MPGMKGRGRAALACIRASASCWSYRALLLTCLFHFSSASSNCFCAGVSTSSLGKCPTLWSKSSWYFAETNNLRLTNTMSALLNSPTVTFFRLTKLGMETILKSFERNFLISPCH
eukprot:Skav231687  [mRNA]  locus=scaffold597:970835:984677:- [translate_table: standard]